MLQSDRIRVALDGLTRNRARSALTTLGIIVGISAVILVMALSQGASDLILKQVQGIGARTVIVRAGQDPHGPSDIGEFFTDTLRQREVDALRDPARVRGVQEVIPNVINSVSVAAGSETTRVTTLGTSPAFLSVFDLPKPDGAFLTEEDIRGRASVAVLGAEVKRSLFGEADALGHLISVKQRSLRVVGVLPPAGQAGVFDVDRLVLLPYSTQQSFLGIKHFHSIILQASSEDAVDQAAEDARATLRELHGVTDPEKDDFFVATQADLLEIIGTVTRILAALLVSIAGVSLVVGGIGIMNIMLVSVTERTREIGLRKALGASTRDILLQFLLEAVFLTVFGGLVGVLLGSLLSIVAGFILSARLGVSWTSSVPWSAAVIGVLVSAAVGISFGLYPARRAARKDPVEALRYE